MIFTIVVDTTKDLSPKVVEVLGTLGWTDVSVEEYCQQNQDGLRDGMRQAALETVEEALLEL